MARVVRVFLVLFAVATCVMTFERTTQAQHTDLATAAARVGVGFVVPDSPVASEPDHVLSALQGAAKETGVNVFRTQLGYTAQSQAETTHYVLLVGPTDFFRPFDVEGGRVLTPADDARRSTFMATSGQTSADQVGVIRDLGHVDHVRIQPFATVYDSLPAAGLYYLEPTTRKQSAAAFLSAFVMRLNALDPSQAPLTTEQLRPHSAGAGASVDGLARLLLGGQYLLVVITVVLLVYYQFAQSKRVGILWLHGYGSTRIWWTVMGRLMASTLGGAAVVLTLLSRLVPGATWAFAWQICFHLLIAAASLVFASLVAGGLVSRGTVSSALKNRKDTGRIFALNSGLKAVSSIALVVTGAGLLQQFHLASHQRAMLGDWSATRRYGIFYPSSVGNDAAEIAAGLPGPAAAEVFELYPATNARGALYVDATQFEPVALAQPMGGGAFRSMTVNPNYLRQYPIRDARGAPVTVSESSTDWVLLVPSNLRSSEGPIRRYFQTTRTGDAGQGGAVSSEKSVFGRSVSTAVAAQHVRIIWTLPGQDIFSFDPDVGPARGNRVRDPIVQVMTLANSLGVDRENAITGAASSALKVPLRGNDTTSTLTDLAPLLRATKLDDNLRNLVTMSGYVDEQLRRLDDGIRSILVVGAALALIMAALVAQGMSVAFDRYSRRVVVRRLLGHPVMSRYREYLRLLLVLWAVQLVVALTANAAGASPFTADASTATPASGDVVLLTVITLAAEGTASLMILALIERRRMTDVLKREF